jgi:hypothetical protein
MNDVDLLALFQIDYVDWNSKRQVFFVFPDQIGVKFGKRRWDFKVRKQSVIDPSNIARFFQFELVERDDGWWRVDMIGQLSGFSEFEHCGLSGEVILAVARRYRLRICSSTPEECQVVKAREVWLRLQKRFNDTPGEFNVAESEARFWLSSTENSP